MVPEQRSRSWHARKVFAPWPIDVEWQGRSFHFMETLEARWSQSRRRWIWRLPSIPLRATAD